MTWLSASERESCLLGDDTLQLAHVAQTIMHADTSSERKDSEKGPRVQSHKRPWAGLPSGSFFSHLLMVIRLLSTAPTYVGAPAPQQFEMVVDALNLGGVGDLSGPGHSR